MIKKRPVGHPSPYAELTKERCVICKTRLNRIEAEILKSDLCDKCVKYVNKRVVEIMKMLRIRLKKKNKK